MEKLKKIFILAFLFMLLIAIIFCSLYFNKSCAENETTTPSIKTKEIDQTNVKGKTLCCLNIIY